MPTSRSEILTILFLLFVMIALVTVGSLANGLHPGQIADWPSSPAPVSSSPVVCGGDELPLSSC